jgi:hypothetical protein
MVRSLLRSAVAITVSLMVAMVLIIAVKLGSGTEDRQARLRARNCAKALSSARAGPRSTSSRSSKPRVANSLARSR